MPIASLIVKIGADLAELVQGVNKANQTLEGFGEAASLVQRRLTEMASVTAITAAAQRVGDFGGQIVDMSEKLGVSIEMVQRLGFAASQHGSSLAALGGVFDQMSRRLVGGEGSTVGALTSLNLSLEVLRKSSPDQAFLAIAGAIDAMPPSMERSAVAMQLLGRGGAELIPMFKSLREDMERAVVASDSLVRAADELGDTMDSLKGTGTGLLAYFLLPLSKSLGLIESAIAGVVRAWGNVSDAFGGTGFVTAAAGAAKHAQALLDDAEAATRARGALEPMTMTLQEADRIARELTDQLKAQNAEIERLAKIGEGFMGTGMVDRARDYLGVIADLKTKGLEPMRSSWDDIVRVITDAQRVMEETGRTGEAMFGQLEAARRKFSGLTAEGLIPSRSLDVMGLAAGPAAIASDESITSLRRMADETVAFTKGQEKWNTEMQDGLVIIGQVDEAAETHVAALDRMGGGWRRLGLEAASAIKLMVPPGFSFTEAYREAGLFVHDIGIAGSAVTSGKTASELQRPWGMPINVNVGTFVGSDRNAMQQLGQMMGNEIMQKAKLSRKF